jgi:hypothetical protein
MAISVVKAQKPVDAPAVSTCCQPMDQRVPQKDKDAFGAKLKAWPWNSGAGNPHHKRSWPVAPARLSPADLGFPALKTRNENPRPFSNGSTVAVTSNTG